MHWPQYVALATWWGSMVVSGGRYAWHHWRRPPAPPDPDPPADAYPIEPDYYDYIEDRYRDQ